MASVTGPCIQPDARSSVTALPWALMQPFPLHSCHDYAFQPSDSGWALVCQRPCLQPFLTSPQSLLCQPVCAKTLTEALLRHHWWLPEVFLLTLNWRPSGWTPSARQLPSSRPFLCSPAWTSLARSSLGPCLTPLSSAVIFRPSSGPCPGVS